MTRCRAIPALLLAFAALFPAAADGAPPTKELLIYFPEEANALMRVNVAEIVKSPRGVREKWGQKKSVEYLAGAIPLHPNIQSLLIGTRIDPARVGAPWSIALIPTLKDVPLETLARKMQGTVEEIGDEKVVATKNAGFYIPLAHEVIGNVSSNERQFCAKWLKFARTNTKPLVGAYLQNAVEYGGNAHILLAVETDDMIDPKGLYNALAASKLFDQDAKLFASAQKFLAGLRGVRIAIVFGQSMRATISLDSKAGAMPGLAALKPFLIQLMAHNGTSLEDMPGAKVEIVGNTVSFELALSDVDLMKITAVLGCPLVHPGVDTLSSENRVDVVPDAVDPTASHRYYRTVNQYVSELRRNAQTSSTPLEWNRRANWYQVYANKISQVSVLNVDPEVLAYGQAAQQRFLAIAESLRGTPIQLDKLAAKAYYYIAPSYGIGLWSYPTTSTNIPQIQIRQNEIIEKDKANRDAAWKMIDEQRQAVRIKMKAKYDVDFDNPLP